MRYEQKRFDELPEQRRRLPFAWGLEHIGGDADDPHPRAFLDRFVGDAISHERRWYASTPAPDYALKDNILTFTSQIAIAVAGKQSRLRPAFSRAKKDAPRWSCWRNGTRDGRSSKRCAAG